MIETPTDCDGELNDPAPTKNVSQLALLKEEFHSKAHLQKCLNFNVDGNFENETYL